jgi:hypothetical protein
MLIMLPQLLLLAEALHSVVGSLVYGASLVKKVYAYYKTAVYTQ